MLVYHLQQPMLGFKDNNGETYVGTKDTGFGATQKRTCTSALQKKHPVYTVKWLVL